MMYFTVGTLILAVTALIGGIGYTMTPDLNWFAILLFVVAGIALVAKGISDESPDDPINPLVASAAIVSWLGGIGLYQAIFGNTTWVWLLAWIGISTALSVWAKRLSS